MPRKAKSTTTKSTSNAAASSSTATKTYDNGEIKIAINYKILTPDHLQYRSGSYAVLLDNVICAS